MIEKCLIIGLGKIGMGYDLSDESGTAIRSHARAITLHPSFELAGAIDSSARQCSIFKDHYKGQIYRSLKQALVDLRPTVVIIATPTITHKKICMEVLSHIKPKVILCEKPLAYALEEAREILELCEDCGVGLFVNYIRRADPGVIEIKKRFESCAIQLPVKGHVWYSKGFLNNGSHFFNLLEYWLGDFAKATILNSGRLWENCDPEPDVKIEFASGEVVFQAAWAEMYSHNTLELLSPSGRLRYDDGGKNIIWQGVERHPSLQEYNILGQECEAIANGLSHYQSNVFNQLVNVIDGKSNSLCSGREALKTLEAMNQITSQ